MRWPLVLILCGLVLLLLAQDGSGLRKRGFRRITRVLRFLIRGRRLAHAVRMAFHDCVGGCDGCLNFDHPDNQGNSWRSTINFIDYIYDTWYYPFLSRADFYQIAGLAAIDVSIENANRHSPGSIPKHEVEFRFGRVDCPTSPLAPPGTNANGFPSGHFGFQEVLNFFSGEFGMTQEEAVGVMGAHTLGGATGENGSGWIGFWKENQAEGNKWDTQYYQKLVDGFDRLDFQQVEVSAQTNFAQERWQWHGFNSSGQLESFMLNADVSLALKPTFDANGMATCGYRDCPRDEEGMELIEEMIDGDEWMDAFNDGWQKLIENGYGEDELHELLD